MHYLDDFIQVLKAVPNPSKTLRTIDRDYEDLTNALGLLRNESKDAAGTAVEALGVEIDSIAMTARLSQKKLDKALRLILQALTANQLTQL